MAKHHLPLLVVAILLSTAVASAAAVSAYEMLEQYGFPLGSAYEMVEQYGFPRGILPEGVQNYTLHLDGDFEMSLLGDCVISVDDYKLQFRSHFSGHIQSKSNQSGSIDMLDGVSVKVETEWIGIDDVHHDGDLIIFHAGQISKSYPVNDLAKSPRCE